MLHWFYCRFPTWFKKYNNFKKLSKNWILREPASIFLLISFPMNTFKNTSSTVILLFLYSYPTVTPKNLNKLDKKGKKISFSTAGSLVWCVQTLRRYIWQVIQWSLKSCRIRTKEPCIVMPILSLNINVNHD